MVTGNTAASSAVLDWPLVILISSKFVGFDSSTSSATIYLAPLVLDESLDIKDIPKRLKNVKAAPKMI